MRIVPYDPEYRQTWNAFCDSSNDAWFWHRRDWLDYARDFLGETYRSDESFMVENDGDIVAVAPCMAVAEREAAGVRLGIADQPLPWPAFSKRLGAQQREKAERLIYEEYRAVSLRAESVYVELFGVVLAHSFYRAAFPPANRPLRYGYTGSVFDTHVIDLTQPMEILWREVRKGHKSAIKAGKNAFDIKHYVGEDPGEAFLGYQELHALAAGRVTRSRSTFDAMRNWIRTGNGLLVAAREGAKWVGFVYMLLYQNAAYYASACNHPDVSVKLPVGHALLWEALLRCRDLGIELLEMGLQTYATPGCDTSPDKLVSISHFKRGFGGFELPRYHARLDGVSGKRIGSS